MIIAQIAFPAIVLELTDSDIAPSIPIGSQSDVEQFRNDRPASTNEPDFDVVTFNEHYQSILYAQM